MSEDRYQAPFALPASSRPRRGPGSEAGALPQRRRRPAGLLAAEARAARSSTFRALPRRGREGSLRWTAALSRRPVGGARRTPSAAAVPVPAGLPCARPRSSPPPPRRPGSDVRPRLASLLGRPAGVSGVFRPGLSRAAPSEECAPAARAREMPTDRGLWVSVLSGSKEFAGAAEVRARVLPLTTRCWDGRRAPRWSRGPRASTLVCAPISRPLRPAPRHTWRRWLASRRSPAGPRPALRSPAPLPQPTRVALRPARSAG